MHFSPVDIGYFLEVVRQSHLGRAALECGVTQPAITKAVRRLEAQVGAPLFERGAHGARLTPPGRLFLETARRFQLQHADLVRTAAELRAQTSGLLRLGLTAPSSDSDAVRGLATLLHSRPGLRVQLAIGKSDTLARQVEEGALDMAVLPLYPGIRLAGSQQVLSEDRLQLTVRAGHPLLALPRPTLADTVDHGWILPSRTSAVWRVVADVFADAGLPAPRVCAELDFTSETVLGLLCHSDLLALVPASSLRGWGARVRTVALPALSIARTLVLLTRRDVAWTPLMQALRDALVPADR